MLDKRKITIYPSLSDHLPQIPERTILYPLEPIGIGTPYCESLISYLYRLAYAHAISLDDLVSMLIQVPWEKNKKHIYNQSKTTIYLVSQLEAFTQLKYLKSLTLLKWSKIIYFHGLYSFSIRWCPFCLSEWQQSKQTLYIPIMWLLSLIKKCLRHNVELQDTCCHCRYQPERYHKKFVIGYCPKCKSWQGKQEKLSQRTSYYYSHLSRESWQEYVRINLSQLIVSSQHQSSLDNLNSLSTILRKFLNFHSMTSGDLLNSTAFSRLTGIGDSCLSSYLKSRQNPHLERFLHISFYFNVSLVQLLTEDINTLIPKLNYY